MYFFRSCGYFLQWTDRRRLLRDRKTDSRVV